MITNNIYNITNQMFSCYQVNFRENKLNYTWQS